jgi:hypothetical protein
MPLGDPLPWAPLLPRRNGAELKWTLSIPKHYMG